MCAGQCAQLNQLLTAAACTPYSSRDAGFNIFEDDGAAADVQPNPAQVRTVADCTPPPPLVSNTPRAAAGCASAVDAAELPDSRLQGERSGAQPLPDV